MRTILRDPEVAQAERAERSNLNTCFAQSFRIAAAERLGAEGIVEKENTHAGLRALGEYFFERVDYLARPRVVHLHCDGLPGIS